MAAIGRILVYIFFVGLDSTVRLDFLGGHLLREISCEGNVDLIISFDYFGIR